MLLIFVQAMRKSSSKIYLFVFAQYQSLIPLLCPSRRVADIGRSTQVPVVQRQRRIYEANTLHIGKRQSFLKFSIDGWENKVNQFNNATGDNRIRSIWNRRSNFDQNGCDFIHGAPKDFRSDGCRSLSSKHKLDAQNSIRGLPRRLGCDLDHTWEIHFDGIGCYQGEGNASCFDFHFKRSTSVIGIARYIPSNFLKVALLN